MHHKIVLTIACVPWLNSKLYNILFYAFTRDISGYSRRCIARIYKKLTRTVIIIYIIHTYICNVCAILRFYSLHSIRETFLSAPLMLPPPYSLAYAFTSQFINIFIHIARSFILTPYIHIVYYFN